MDEPGFNWEPHHLEQHLMSNIKTTYRLPPFNKEEICLIVDATNIGDIFALANTPNDDEDEAVFSYATIPKNVVTDNYAAHHI